MVLTTELLGIRNALAEKKEIRNKKAAAKGKVKYPNPAFWRCKDNMDFKAQGKNLMLRKLTSKAFALSRWTDARMTLQDAHSSSGRQQR